MLTLAARILLASLAIGAASWASYMFGRRRTLDAARCAQAVQDEMQALGSLPPSAGLFAALAAMGFEPDPNEQTVHSTDGFTVRVMSYRGAKINTWDSGSC